jgi:NADH-quinone oxidoreductase subunit N
VVAVLNAAIAAAYYLRVIGAMYFRSPEKRPFAAQRGFGPALAIGLCVVFTVGIGLLPGKLLDGAIRAGQSLSDPVAQGAAIQRSHIDRLSAASVAAEPASH